MFFGSWAQEYALIFVIQLDHFILMIGLLFLIFLEGTQWKTTTNTVKAVSKHDFFNFQRLLLPLPNCHALLFSCMQKASLTSCICANKARKFCWHYILVFTDALKDYFLKAITLYRIQQTA